MILLDADRADLPAHLSSRRRRPTQVIPALRPVAVGAYQLRRWLVWHTSGVRFARTRAAAPLPHEVHHHTSPLLRQLGDSEMWMQHNKIVNLRLAVRHLDGILIQPGETFSFCRLVGRTTAKRGYLDGLTLDGGRAVPGMAGGICQIANTLHWMVLHTPLTVVQRSSHSEDPFPDDGRTVPWGTGCTIFYNYVDLQFRNDTPDVYQVALRVGPTHLEGALRCSGPPRRRYRVYAQDERFLHVDGAFYRANEIWREITEPDGSTRTEKLKENFARTLYDPRRPSRRS